MPANQEGSAPFGGASGDEGFRPSAAANDPYGPKPPQDSVVPATDLFKQSVRDAEQLLSHAAQTGRFPLEAPGSKDSFKQWVIDGVMNARVAVEEGTLTKGVASAFWASFADLSRITSPVTAATLRMPDKRWLGSLDYLVIILVAVLIPLSVVLFINTSTANQVSELVERQNNTALKLWSQVQYSRNAANIPNRPPNTPSSAPGEGQSDIPHNRAYGIATQAAAGVARLTPDELFAEVVEFSRRSFSLRETAVRLNRFLHFFLVEGLAIDENPIEFEGGSPVAWSKYRLSPLNVSAAITTPDQIQAEAIKQISMYQPIRDFAQAVSKMNSTVYGAVTAYFLPALYALLGAALYGLRHYTRLVQQRAYFKTSANTARYFIALIAGTAIGLFGSLLSPDVSLSPLVIAFLMGYAVDAFFSRLDSLIARIVGDEATRPAPVADVPSGRTVKSG